MAVAMDTTRHVLEALSTERPTNRSTLCRRLELEGDALNSILTELADCGLVGCAGKRVVSTAVPGVSPEAALLYAALPAGGTTMGNIGLRGRLGFDEETYSLAKQELLDAGRVRRSIGYGGTLARITAEPAANMDGHDVVEVPRESAPTAADLSPTALMILAGLPRDGSTKGNIQLRSLLDIEDDAYAASKQELLDAGLVRAGKGKGGTLARVETLPPTDESQVAHLVRRESELYEPFAKHLHKDLDAEKDGDEAFRFGHVFVSATPSGHRRNSGQWSRPDVTQIRVTSYPVEYLPAVTVEVSAYEIKRNVEADRLESVYEAAAHGRWAHMANLVVELQTEEAAVSPSIQAEANRLGIGLYTMCRRDDGTFRIRQILEPQPWVKEPELKNVDELLERTFRGDTDHRQKYKEAIHR
jgi:hypothetical protein